MKLDKNFWNKKKVLITGHTGFKGGWLSVILNLLGSKVSGYALNPVGKNNFFKHAKVKNVIENDIRHDISDRNYLVKKIKQLQPEVVVHLAAQSSVIESFKNPRNTVITNTIGTFNLLEAIKKVKSVKCVLIITTDKVYQNYEASKYFDENSKLGGDDIYSGSKACCEILVNSYRKSFFQKSSCRIATARAGNCFGGGDWTEDRIVKDAVECFYENKRLVLRNPEATRPWQHVMEPLFGYLLLIQKLCSKKGDNYQGPWNFGPSIKQNLKVIKLVKIIKRAVNSGSKIIVKKNFKKFKNKNIKIFESKHLNINSNKAKKFLKWFPFLTIKSSVDLTVEWYKAFKDKKNLLFFSRSQISSYIKKVNLT
tara:strand:+ start:3914 stop:5014 length:1101 start_codon:yes stop_codon:yes gene_type:complete